MVIIKFFVDGGGHFFFYMYQSNIFWISCCETLERSHPRKLFITSADL